MNDETTTLLADLIRIDSVNPSLVPGAAGEAEIATYVAKWAEEQGLQATIIGADPARPSVIITAGADRPGEALILCGHLDTVGVAGMTDPFEPVITDGRMFGRGCYDMLGGLAAALIACRNAQRDGSAGPVHVLAVADEEHSSVGVQEAIDRVRATAAVVTEPTELNVGVAHRGFVWVEITVLGKAAHGSRPLEGVDAILGSAPLLAGLRELSDRIAVADPHPLVGPGVLHGSLIDGGREESTIPDRLTLTVERRTLPGETTADVLAEIDAVLAACRAADPALVIDRRVTLARPPLQTPADGALARSLVEISGAAISGLSYWADSAFLAAAGLPTVLYGPAGGGAHAEVEWVELDSVITCAEVLTRLARTFGERP